MPNFFNEYPYTDFHELNLDWLIAKMKKLQIQFDEFKVVNNITFSGQWDITKQYPAWTIVSDNNIGYVSIQPVPVGVVLTNTDYWVEVIDYTAQIAGLQQRVVNIENDIADNIKPDITANTSDIIQLQRSVNMSDRYFLFVGDSYGDRPSAQNWVNYTINYADIVNYDNLCVSGSGFNDLSFNNQIINYTGDKTRITDIVVGGGLNDALYTGQDLGLLQNIADFAAYAKANYPNARLWLAFMGNAIDDAALLNGRTYDKRYWAKWMYNNARSYGFTIIKYTDIALSTSTGNYADKIHPNQNGAMAIARVVANAITGVQGDVIYPQFTAGFSFNSNFSGSLSISYTVNNDITTLSNTTGSSIYFNPTATITIAGATDVEMGTFDNLYFNKPVYASCKALLYDRDNMKLYMSPAQLTLSGNKMYLTVYNVKDDKSGWNNVSLTVNSRLFIYNDTITFPTEYIN